MGRVACHPGRTEVVAAGLTDHIAHHADVLTSKGLGNRLHGRAHRQSHEHESLRSG